MHRDFPNCRSSGIKGELIDSQQQIYAVDACGVPTTYQCPPPQKGLRMLFGRCNRIDGGASAQKP
ncbi:MAG: hypothetical protein NZM37_09085 [Sandaracinaceae bacterium]|nr:hypothetical protein [Sandaracinaceae bacterium]